MHPILEHKNVVCGTHFALDQQSLEKIQSKLKKPGTPDLKTVNGLKCLLTPYRNSAHVLTNLNILLS